MKDHSLSLGRHSADFADINLRRNYALKWSEIQAAHQEPRERKCKVQEEKRERESTQLKTFSSFEMKLGAQTYLVQDRIAWNVYITLCQEWPEMLHNMLTAF